MTFAPPDAARLSAPSVVTEIPGPRSRELHAERENAVSSGFGTVLPVFVDHAEGAVLVDVDGNRFIDLASGIAVTSVGAAHPRVAERIAQQAARFTHTCFMVTEYESYVRVAEWLNARVPGEWDKRTALFSTGAEAVENAVKIARKHTGRPGVLVLDEAYHGRSLLTMAMTAKEHPYRSGFGPLPDDVVVRATNGNALRSGLDTETALAEVERVLQAHGPESFAALVVEPIQGEGGFNVPQPGFLAGLAGLARAHGIVFVVDEIQAGLGRTGRLFASEHDDIAGDLTLTAKALGGGMPISAVTGRSDIMNAVHTGGLGGTYAGNPVACEAALAVFEVLDDPETLQNVARIEQAVRERLDPLVDELGVVADVRGRGAMLAIEFADADLSPLPELTSAISRACHAAGVLTLTTGTHGNVIRLLPPLIAEPELVARGVDILVTAIKEAAA
ncbi:aminotransferase class III-fold pyridoxal phosphate-dependent enzyme [Microbacterium sp. JB110]|uniref:aminotransferase class III-fold pyridoxal phosphate-dependent enzyme n=1 Tax=Microbacterium sp. JB110 TaxID=2024477 RepID=UPI00097EB99D|nr:aminotransferase class III-fold pyridoxal phosphate-dependent enzyme [Microbacterium sp. JB110]RCS60353.1 aminotransferase class III-fold pyridoxal phosphate-dependent enzyme [Microbacterium sp. JB110]SJM49015.1 Gamma-aminobutyrate:alpha-ketoglutarate aminotransferase [Frigoribacterium sp. JB110]